MIRSEERRAWRRFENRVKKLVRRRQDPTWKPCATAACPSGFFVAGKGGSNRQFCDECRREYGLVKPLRWAKPVQGAVLSYPDVDATIRGLIAVRLAKGHYVGQLLCGTETPAEEAA